MMIKKGTRVRLSRQTAKDCGLKGRRLFGTVMACLSEIKDGVLLDTALDGTFRYWNKQDLEVVKT